MNALRSVSLAVAASVLVSCAGGQRLKTGQKVDGGEVVEAEGLVPFRSDDVPGTEAASLAAAQRAAVEKVVGVFVSAKTRVEKAVTVESKILANTSGYISKYDILSKGREGDFHRTKIRALVLIKKIGEDLRELGVQDLEALGNPRVAVLIEEFVDGQPSDASDGAQGIAEALISKGFTVVERSAAAGAATQKALDAMSKGDVKGVADLGSQIGAEVVVAGQIRAQQLEASLGGLISYRARASLQAVRSGSGQIVGTAARDASGLDATKATASGKAAQNAGSLAADELGPRVIQTLKNQAQIDIVLSGVSSFGHLQRFQDELRSIPGTGTVNLRSYDQGLAEISLSGTSKPASELSAFFARMKNVSVEVETYTPNRIQAVLKP